MEPGTAVDVILRGTGFAPRVAIRGKKTAVVGGFEARLGEVELEEVRFIDARSLSARVPSTLGRGVHALFLRDPRGREASLEDAFCVDCAVAVPPSIVPPQGGAPPVARIRVTPRFGSPATSFQLDGSMSANAETHAWDLDADGSPDAAGPIVVHSFASLGTHQVSLLVTGPAGLSDGAHAEVTVAGAVIIVDTALDVVDGRDGATSLREAIRLANADGTSTAIGFSGPMTIRLAAPLDPITDDGTAIIGEPGVIIDGTQSDADNCFTITSSFNRLESLEIMGCANNGIEILNAASNVITSCRIHEIGDDAIDMSTALAGNRIGPNNVLYNTDSRCLEIEGDDTLVIDNEFHDCLVGAIRVRLSSARARIVGNVIRRSDIGILVTDYSRDAHIVHNTFHANPTEAVRVESSSSGHDVRNNVFDRNGMGVVAVQGLSVLGRNLYFSNRIGECSGCLAEPDRMTSDPLFVDPLNGDFRPAAGSPCLDAAIDLGLDRNGSRPGSHEGAGPEIGALEVW